MIYRLLMSPMKEVEYSVVSAKRSSLSFISLRLRKEIAERDISRCSRRISEKSGETSRNRSSTLYIIYIYVYIKQLLHTRARARNTKQWPSVSFYYYRHFYVYSNKNIILITSVHTVISFARAYAFPSIYNV